MKLNLADRLALIYTSAGSLRKTAALAGLSHQQVSRILHRASEGGDLSRYEAKAELVAAVDVAFEIHKDISRETAKRHKIPFSSDVPIFAERLALRHQGVFVNGELVFKGSPEYCRDYIAENDLEGQAKIKRLLGERVGALHLHWLSDRLRNKWITNNQKTGAYYAATAGSVVNLKLYSKAANERAKEKKKRGIPRSHGAILAKDQIAKAMREGEQQKRVFTRLVSMDPRHVSESVIENLNEEIERKHAPAIGEKGTALADQILLQLDTRANEAKHAKTSGSKRGNSGSKAKAKARR